MIDTYAVMGNPVAHSKSPFIHAEFAKETHESLRYTKLEVPIDRFEQQVNLFQRAGGKGLNITVPFKQRAYQLATLLTERANLAGAVNTIKFESDGQILGDNTDGIGLVTDLCKNHHLDLSNKTILILGAGGAVRGILEPICQLHPKQIVIANRTVSTAVKLVTDFSEYTMLAATDLSSITGNFEVIINGTSASLQQKALGLPPTILTESTFCYDLVYGDQPTPFLDWAITNGVKAYADGIGMLVEQAAESFYLWRGVKPDTKKVIALLRSL